MRKYHILFNETGDFISKGLNFFAIGPVEAISHFRIDYPTATFIGLYDIDALSSLHINRKAIQDQVDRDELKQTKN